MKVYTTNLSVGLYEAEQSKYLKLCFREHRSLFGITSTFFRDHAIVRNVPDNPSFLEKIFVKTTSLTIIEDLKFI